MCNKFADHARQRTWDETGLRVRNIKIGHPVLGCEPGGKPDRILKVSDVERRGSCAVVCNLEGRRSGAVRSRMEIKGGHRHGVCCHERVFRGNLLPNNVRVVYLDVREVRWCSVGSVAFHGFAWPRIAREAKPIARPLFTNRCHWAGVLVAHGRGFCSHQSCRSASMVFDDLL